jgi:UDP-N-acetylmuramate--alanine ligase
VTYGFSPEWDYHASDVSVDGMGSRFRLCAPDGEAEVSLKVPGDHNVLNALGTAAIAHALGVPIGEIAAGLAQFGGVKRRFEIRFSDPDRKITVVDDYGHHPTEIAATLAAARRVWPGRIVTVFQPHRYSRTLHCRDGFLACFGASDVVLMTDIYAAGEDPLPGVDSASLVEDLRRLAPARQEILHVGSLDRAETEALRRIRPGDLVICLGAGSITKLPDLLAAGLGAPR